MQIAHLIVQLTERLKQVQQGIATADLTLIILWEDMVGIMRHGTILKAEAEEMMLNTKQLRYKLHRLPRTPAH